MSEALIFKELNTRKGAMIVSYSSLSLFLLVKPSLGGMCVLIGSLSLALSAGCTSAISLDDPPEDSPPCVTLSDEMSAEGGASAGAISAEGCQRLACLEDSDCEEAHRCIQGVCYENQCEDGEERVCENDCGQGVQRCLGGVWRGCSASTLCVEAGVEGGVEQGGTRAGATAGVDMGGQEQGGAGGGEVCLELEVCSDGEDQDCDGRVDEGCMPCVTPTEEPLLGPSEDYFNVNAGVVRLGAFQQKRWALFSRDSLTHPAHLYQLNAIGSAWVGRYDLEDGEARAVFEGPQRVGLLLRTTRGLEARLFNTSTSRVERDALITSSSSDEEVALLSSSRLLFAWRDNTDDVQFSVTSHNLTREEGPYQLNEGAHLSARPSLTATSEAVVTLFEDQSEQSAQPWVYGARWRVGEMGASARLIEGAHPHAVWSDGSLRLFAQREVGAKTQLISALLDHTSDLLTPSAPRVSYETDNTLELLSVSRLAGGELFALWREVLGDGTSSEHQLLGLTMNIEGEPLTRPVRLGTSHPQWSTYYAALYDVYHSDTLKATVRSVRIEPVSGIQQLTLERSSMGVCGL